MSIVVSPISYGYSADGFQSDIKQKPKISREELREYVKADKIYSEVAAEHPGLSVSVYNNLLDKFGFPKDTVRIQSRRDKTLKEMYEAGHSIEEMAAAIGVKPNTCRAYLIDLGLSTNKVAMLARKKEEMKVAIESSPNRRAFAKKIGLGQKSAQKLIEELGTDTANNRKKVPFAELKRSNFVEWIEKYKTPENIARHVHYSVKKIIKAIQDFGLKV